MREAEVIKLLEKVLRIFDGEKNGMFSTREIIHQALTLLRAKPSAGEFTKAIRIYIKAEENSCLKDSYSTLIHLKDACVLLDASRAELKAKDEECEGLKKALEHITEYWNKDENHGAMSDALDEILTTAEQALSPKG